MAACLQRRIDKSYKTGEFNEETIFGTVRTGMQYLFPSALTAVEISLLTQDAQLSLFQRSLGNTKGCVGFLILLRLCAHVSCLGWARGVFLWLSNQAEHLCRVHDALCTPCWLSVRSAKDSQASSINSLFSWVSLWWTSGLAMRMIFGVRNTTREESTISVLDERGSTEGSKNDLSFPASFNHDGVMGAQ